MTKYNTIKPDDVRRAVKRKKWAIIEAINKLRIRATDDNPAEIGINVFLNRIEILTDAIGEGCLAVGVVYPDADEVEVYAYLRDEVEASFIQDQ